MVQSFTITFFFLTIEDVLSNLYCSLFFIHFFQKPVTWVASSFDSFGPLPHSDQTTPFLKSVSSLPSFSSKKRASTGESHVTQTGYKVKIIPATYKFN